MENKEEVLPWWGKLAKWFDDLPEWKAKTILICLGFVAFFTVAALITALGFLWWHLVCLYTPVTLTFTIVCLIMLLCFSGRY